MWLCRWLTVSFTLLLKSSVGWAGDDVALVGLDDLWRFTGLKSTSVAPLGWQEVGFDDSLWLSGPSGFGTPAYGEGFPVSTNGWERVLLRTRFVIPEPVNVQWLSLRTDFAGGFVAWLNGVEIARRGISGFPDSIPSLISDATPHLTGNAELIYIGLNNGLIVNGTNLLTVQLHADNVYSRWPVFSAELLANFSRAPYLQNVSSNQAELHFATPLPLSARVEFGTNSLAERTVSLPIGTRHRAILTGLQPGVPLQFRVVVNEGPRTAATRPLSFKPLPMNGPLTVQVIGDSGGGDLWQHRVTEQMGSSGADLMLHTGDIIYPNFSPGLADIRFLSVQRPIMRSIPSFFAWGNHDLYYGTAPFLDVLYAPTNTTSASDHLIEGTLPQSYYSFDAGEVHFVVLFQPLASQYLLRTNSPQALWLERDLAASSQPWKVLICHLPFETSGLHRFDDYNFNGLRDSAEFAAAVLPIAQRYGVQLTLSGHDHDFERLVPLGGVTSIVTGGGGGMSYPLGQSDPRSATFLAVYHYTRLQFKTDHLLLQCIDWQGKIQDESVIYRSPPVPRFHQAVAASAQLETSPANDGDGNNWDQIYDFLDAPPIPSFTGKNSNLGQLRVMFDATHLYLGLDGIALDSGSDLYLFLELPGLSGVDSLKGLGDGILNPERQGVDALDFAESLSFKFFRPSIALVLGDELADGVQRNFRRSGSTHALGQGAFHMDAGFTSLNGVLIQQFNRSIQTAAGSSGESTANFIEVSIPRSELGELNFGQELRIGGVVGLSWDGSTPSRRFDSGFIGDSLTVEPDGSLVLQGLPVQLPSNPDPDGDGLNAAGEKMFGTDPMRADSDDDGLPDGWEVRAGTNPLTGLEPDGPEGDRDNDGTSNLEEFTRGTSPRDPWSPLELSINSVASGKLQLHWHSGKGRLYAIETATSVYGPFKVVEGFPKTAESNRQKIEFAAEMLPQFYRLRVID